MSYVQTNPLVFNDFVGQWKLCAYTLQGVDPYPLIGAEKRAIKELGLIPLKWSATLWGLLLGNLFYPGFLPPEFAASIPAAPLTIEDDLLKYRSINQNFQPAEIYFFVLSTTFLFATAATVFVTLKKFSVEFAAVSSLFALISMPFVIPLLNAGNAAGIIACLLTFSCLLHDKYPKLTGIFLAFAMVKRI